MLAPVTILCPRWQQRRDGRSCCRPGLTRRAGLHMHVDNMEHMGLRLRLRQPPWCPVRLPREEHLQMF
eukprot:scaffold16384_cov67-Phaeocystis_antarctica.AAC.3